jgi:putative transcriptional regulator
MTRSPCQDRDVFGQHSLRGRLLVAAPPLVDPNFDRTVVLMLEHGEDGALGIVLNRPSATALQEVFPEWRELVSPPVVAFAGGPVATDAVIALARRRPAEPVDGFTEILDDLGTINLADDPDDVAPSLRSLRVFAGYAGWAPEQLDAEIAQGAWFDVAMRPDDPFAPNPERLWRDVLRRQRGRLSVFSNFPEDASVN